MITKEYDPFRAQLSAARRAPALTAKDLTALCAIKKTCARFGSVGLNKDEERWLTRLAKKGGWTNKPEDSTFAYVTDEEPV